MKKALKPLAVAAATRIGTLVGGAIGGSLLTLDQQSQFVAAVTALCGLAFDMLITRFGGR